MMTLAGQQRPVRVMSNNNAREKSENEYFQKSNLSHWFGMTKTYFPEVIIFDGAAENLKMKRTQPKIGKDFPPQNT